LTTSKKKGHIIPLKEKPEVIIFYLLVGVKAVVKHNKVTKKFKRKRKNGKKRDYFLPAQF
jgi:hypothetical protein